MSEWLVVAAAAATGLGVAGGRLAPDAALVFAAAAVWSWALAGVARRRTSVAAGALLVSLAFVGAADAAWRVDAERDRVLPRLARERSVAAVCGTVVDRGPRSIEIAARTVGSGERRWSVREPVRVAGDGIEQARLGERVCTSGSVAPGRPGRREPPLVAADRVTVRGVGSPVRLAAGTVRSRFSEAARAVMPDRQAGLLLGMTDGDTQLIDDRTEEEFRRTGLAHLVAVSGSNVAVVLAIAMLAARAVVRRGRWLRLVIAMPPLIFFAFLTSLEPSVLRATATAVVVVVIGATGRTADGLRAAGAAFILLVLASPELLGRVGFQLSFGATIGLILWATRLTERLRALWPREGRAATAVAAAVATTLAAQAAVVPLLAFHFGQVPALGGIANLVVAPLAPVVMLGGSATLGLASLSSAFALAPTLLRLPLDLILWTSRTFASIPFGTADLGVLAAVAISLGAAAALTSSRRVRVGCVALAVSFTGLGIGSGVGAGPPECAERGELRALDVGQGTAVLLRAAGRNVLVDGGPRDGEIAAQLKKLGVRTLDALFVSHPHADHTDGALDVLATFDVGEVIAPVTHSWGVGAQVVRRARAGGIPLRTSAAGDAFSFGPRLHVDVLSPEPGPAGPESDELINPFSLVLRARAGDLEAILPGDVDGATQSELIGLSVQAPVLIAPHHGSADIDPAFIQDVDPELTIVTVGEGNRYGHPRPQAMTAYRRTGAVLRSDQNGTIVVCSGPALEVWSARR